MSEPKRYASVPKQDDSMSTSIADHDFISPCAKEAFDLLNAGARKQWRGQGDTWTAARDRAAEEAGITPAQAERLQKNWRTMKFPNGDVYRLLLRKYGHLCSWIEHAADRIEARRNAIEETHAPFKSSRPADRRDVAADRRDGKTGR